MTIAGLVVLASFTACSVPTADAGGGGAGPMPPFTTYSCDGVVVTDQVARVDPAIVKPWHALAIAPVQQLAWVAEVNRLATRRGPTKLTVEERVRLQHELLVIARRLDSMRRDEVYRVWYGLVHDRVMRMVRVTAPTAGELESLGEGTRPAVHAVLGPALGVTERATETCGNGNSIHVAHNAGLLAFRPLRAGSTRALVAQLVAFDRDGKPHITPLVARMELRLGDAANSPACVVQARPDGTLQVAELGQVEEHAPFVRHRGNGLGCKSCHRGPNDMNARDLTFAETKTVDVARSGQVERLATDLWKSLTQPLSATSRE